MAWQYASGGGEAAEETDPIAGPVAASAAADAAAALASTFAADEWEVHSLLGSDIGRQTAVAAGWTLSANGIHSTQATLHRITGNASGRYLERAMPEAITEDGEFEFRWTQRVEPGGTSNADSGIYADWGADGRGMYFRFADTGGEIALQYLSAAGTWTDFRSAYVRLNGDSRVTVWVRRYTRGSATGGWIEAGVNLTSLGTVPWAGLFNSIDPPVSGIRVLHPSGDAAGQELQLERFACRAGHNAAPVFHGLVAGGWV